MSYQLNHQIHRLEHGPDAAGQRAADRRAGEMAAALDELRRMVAHSLGRGRGAIKGLGRRKPAGKTAALPLSGLAEY